MAVGLVVAGGYSTRFGITEKALVEVGGEPMITRITGTLEAVVDDVVINCRDEQVSPFETALVASADVDGPPAFAVDDEPGAGPIDGLDNGLSVIDRVGPNDTDEVLVVSCDRPGITTGLLAYLSECRRRQDVDVALPAIEGYLQPLCGAYRVGALVDAVESAREMGKERLVSVPRSLSRHLVTERSLAGVVEPSAIASVDTPLDVRLGSQRAPSHFADGFPGEDSFVADDPRVLAGN